MPEAPKRSIAQYLTDIIDLALEGLRLDKHPRPERLEQFFPKLERAEGTLRGTLSVDGTVAQPTWTGEVVVENGAFSVRGFTMPISNVDGKIDIDPKQGIRIAKLHGEVGGGTIDVSGGAKLHGFALGDVDVRTVAKDVHMKYGDGIQLTVMTRPNGTHYTTQSASDFGLWHIDTGGPPTATAYAVAYARQCEMLRKISARRRCCARSLAAPHRCTPGLPSGSLRTSTSVQFRPRRQPVPRHFSTASLAAQRPAKCSVACLRPWQ